MPTISIPASALLPAFNTGQRVILNNLGDLILDEVIAYIVANPSTLDLSVDDLSDVVAPSPVDQDVLTWDSTTSKWVNESVPRALDNLSDVTITTPASQQVLQYNGSAFVNAVLDLDDLSDVAVSAPATSQKLVYNGTNFVNKTENQSIIIACSDETTALTTGTAKVTFRMPYAFTLTAVRASVTTAPTGSTLVVDINENTGGGATSILSTKLSIDISEKTSTTAATPPVISDTALADDSEITIDIDQIGSTVAGAGLKVTLIGYPT